MLPHTILISRIAIGAVLGGVIGYERDLHGRHVGLRTHLIVAMTAATFMVISNHFVDYQEYDHKVEADVARIAASVVSGIGFLAGGAILRTGITIQGMTTAAGLWLVTAVGLSSGAGMFPEAISVTLMGLIALTLLRRFEDKNDEMIRRRVTLLLDDEVNVGPQVLVVIKELGATIIDFDYERRVDEKLVNVIADIQVPVRVGIAAFVEKLESQPGLHRLNVQMPSSK